jgi:hypothetical protein
MKPTTGGSNMSDTAITVHEQRAGSPFDPQTLEQAIDLSARLATSGLVPQALRGKPSDILLVVMAGKELGFSTIQSLRSFYVIAGRIGIHADAMTAVCLRQPFCEYFRLVSTDNKQATYETKRKGSEPVTLSYTIDQAKQALLTKNQTYSAHPDAMLRARCAAALARVVYPDCLAGLYEQSEVDEIVENEPKPRKAKVEVVDPKTGEVVDHSAEEAHALRVISEAQDIERLETLAITFKLLPAQIRPAVRKAWAARKAELANTIDIRQAVAAAKKAMVDLQDEALASVALDGDTRVEAANPTPDPEYADPTLVKFGSAKGQRLSEISDRSLAWYAKIGAEKSDPACKTDGFYKQNLAWFECVKSEVARREAPRVNEDAEPTTTREKQAAEIWG